MITETQAILIAIGLAIPVLVWDLVSDYKKWKKEIPVAHTREGWVRLALLLPSLFFFALPIYHDYFPNWKFFLYAVLSPSALLGSYYLFFFDGIYNLLRKQKFFFPGTDDPDDSITDDFFQKLTPLQHALTKIFLIILFTSVYYLVIRD